MNGWLCTIFAILFSGMITVLSKLKMQREAKQWPPGPRKLPIIGNLHQLNTGGELLHVSLANLAKVYGGMMTIWFGGRVPTIIVSDLDLAWDVLVRKTSDFSARKLPYISRIINADWQTLSTSDLSPFWYNLRNGLHSTTFTPKNIYQQTKVQEEDVSNMLSNLHKEACSSSGVVKPSPHFRRNTIKLIGRFCFGPQFRNEAFVCGMDVAIEEVIRLSGTSRLIHVFEFLAYIPGLNRPFVELHAIKKRIEQLIRPYISSRNCQTDCYSQFLISEDLSENIIIFNLFELFMLAVDSVSSTTSWAIALLIRDQQAQRKLFDEVTRGIDHNQAVTLENIKDCEYLHAVVKETMRMKPIAPLAIPHKAARDTMLGGTKILSGTPVMVNLYKLLNDPNVWVEPHVFTPERFLGTSFISDEMKRSFLPFGAGRRICGGMELAKLQIAFTLASLVREFHWTSAIENQLPDISEKLTIVLMMKTPLAAQITRRAS